MAPRGKLHIEVWFGPSRSPAFSSAVCYARTHADRFEDLGSGSYLASFTLEREDRTYAEAEHLVQMVSGWKTTRIEVEGSPPEHPVIFSWMAACARHWLREVGHCGAWFPNVGGANRCRSCPLYDGTYASEFWVRGSVFPLEEGTEAPDHVPDEWF